MKLRPWYYVFATLDADPDPSAALMELRPQVKELESNVTDADASGRWRRVEYRVGGDRFPTIIVRRGWPGDEDFGHAGGL